MKLVYSETKEPVVIGDKVKDFRGDGWEVTGMQAPRHEGSTGRVYVTQGELSRASTRLCSEWSGWNETGHTEPS